MSGLHACGHRRGRLHASWFVSPTTWLTCCSTLSVNWITKKMWDHEITKWRNVCVQLGHNTYTEWSPTPEWTNWPRSWASFPIAPQICCWWLGDVKGNVLKPFTSPGTSTLQSNVPSYDLVYLSAQWALYLGFLLASYPGSFSRRKEPGNIGGIKPLTSATSSTAWYAAVAYSHTLVIATDYYT